MTNKIIYSIITLLFLSSCQTKKDKTLIEIANKTDSQVVIEIFEYPADYNPKNRGGAFNKELEKDSIYLIKFDEDGIYEKTSDISPIYDTTEFDGYEILVFRPLYKERVFFADKPKDTLYYKRYDLKTIFKEAPIRIDIK